MENLERQLTKQEAIQFFESDGWETMTFAERAHFQANQKFLCMPLTVFHEAVEKTLGRPVWTHEFASFYKPGGLRDQLNDINQGNRKGGE